MHKWALRFFGWREGWRRVYVCVWEASGRVLGEVDCGHRERARVTEYTGMGAEAWSS